MTDEISKADIDRVLAIDIAVARPDASPGRYRYVVFEVWTPNIPIWCCDVFDFGDTPSFGGGGPTMFLRVQMATPVEALEYAIRAVREKLAL